MRRNESQPFVPQAPARAAAFRVLLSCAHGLYKAGNGCLIVAAGLLRRAELQAAAIDQYRDFNLTAIEVDAGLSPTERHFYARFLRDRDRVLLAGCGSGRDLIALRSMGYDVSGLEPVSELVELARGHLTRHGLSAAVHAGLIQTAHLEGPYDAVIFSNGCYSFLQGSDVRVATLQRVARHLARDGRVIVSYLPARHQSRLGRWLARASARVGSADWVPEPGDTFARDLCVPGLVRYHRAFQPEEFARECQAAGLDVLADELFGEGLRFAAAAASAGQGPGRE
jgi:SAM-dependent methyltransferase